MMNILFILMITTVSLLIAAPAMAADVISASDFFYGESVDNNVDVVRVSGVQHDADIVKQAPVLSASDFFYGDMIAIQVVRVESSDIQERIRVTVPTSAQLTPGIFFGYEDLNTAADVNPVSAKAGDEKCNCPNCSNC